MVLEAEEKHKSKRNQINARDCVCYKCLPQGSPLKDKDIQNMDRNKRVGYTIHHIH